MQVTAICTNSKYNQYQVSKKNKVTKNSPSFGMISKNTRDEAASLMIGAVLLSILLYTNRPKEDEKMNVSQIPQTEQYNDKQAEQLAQTQCKVINNTVNHISAHADVDATQQAILKEGRDTLGICSQLDNIGKSGNLGAKQKLLKEINGAYKRIITYFGKQAYSKF